MVKKKVNKKIVKAVTEDKKPASTKKKKVITMRTAFIRISHKNVIHMPNEKLGLKVGDVVYYTVDDIRAILDKWCETKAIQYWFIEHNKGKEDSHFHIVISFPEGSVCALDTLKNKFPYGYIEKCRYGVKKCVQYLVHMNDTDKEPYSWDEVITNAPYKLEEYKLPDKTSGSKKLDLIINNILDGKIKEFEVDKIDPYIYISYKSKIDKAFEYRNKMLMNNPTRNIDVFFLQGPCGAGKTLFCKAWAKNHNKSIAFSSASNDVFSSVNGEDVYVLDDYNPYEMSLENMIKAIDNNTNTTLQSRYHQRLFIGDTIFICTNIDINYWYYGKPPERRKAFFRRIKYVLDFSELGDDKVAHYTLYEIKLNARKELEARLGAGQGRLLHLLAQDRYNSPNYDGDYFYPDESEDKKDDDYIYLSKINDYSFDLKPYFTSNDETKKDTFIESLDKM